MSDIRLELGGGHYRFQLQELDFDDQQQLIEQQISVKETQNTCRDMPSSFRASFSLSTFLIAYQLTVTLQETQRAGDNEI